MVVSPEPAISVSSGVDSEAGASEQADGAQSALTEASAMGVMVSSEP